MVHVRIPCPGPAKERRDELTLVYYNLTLPGLLRPPPGQGLRFVLWRGGKSANRLNLSLRLRSPVRPALAAVPEPGPKRRQDRAPVDPYRSPPDDPACAAVASCGQPGLYRRSPDETELVPPVEALAEVRLVPPRSRSTSWSEHVEGSRTTKMRPGYPLSENSNPHRTRRPASSAGPTGTARRAGAWLVVSPSNGRRAGTWSENPTPPDFNGPR